MNKAYVILYLISVFIATFSQVLLKMSANKKHKKTINELFNFRVIIAYGLFLISLILTTIALKEVPYKIGAVIESVSYLFILAFSWLILKENMDKRILVGNLMIILGIMIFNL